MFAIEQTTTLPISCHNFTSAELDTFLAGSHRTIPPDSNSLTTSQNNTNLPLSVNRQTVHLNPEIATIDPQLLTNPSINDPKSQLKPCVHGLKPPPLDTMEHMRKGLFMTGIQANALETHHLQQLRSSNLDHEGRKDLLRKWRAVTVTIPHFLRAHGTDTSAMTFQDFEDVYHRTCISEDPRPTTFSVDHPPKDEAEKMPAPKKWSPYHLLNLANEMEQQRFAAELEPCSDGFQPGRHHAQVCDADVDYVDDFLLVSSAESARRQRESERVGAKR